MLRRQARERREYLYRKAQELQESQLQQKRQIIKQALAQGKPLPKELAEDEQLQKDFQYDESAQEQIDDEYSATSGIAEPKVIVTTSRDPSTRLSQFAKEIKLLFPTSVRLNRGNYVMPNLVDACQKSGTSDLIVLHEHRGVPTSLTVSHFPHGPTAYFTLHNVVLRHDILNSGNQSEVNPHLIFDNFTTPLGKRVETILKHLFPPGPKKDAARVITFANRGDFISVRQHVYVRTRDGVELAEVGPRFEMKLFELRLGTLENKDADVEWQLRRFVRTANRKDYL
ncbi:U3 small nucleolar ribonucleoprotein IMP4 [Kluyveromyces marxianus]|uniref:U3 small nucleolar ribonucleoprotein protein IMP4 n=2 Tax=Kluyveromyces marxianus TaxID=4911 RepID=W0TE75_KLUMD|nr:U3 small nucleolar ribonucleoprotein protein IMP4 [Kluyveromyces marxianus DMKU3-1042]KAG0677415.1 snoRNA-binding rRNA-processing protein imp4 [Kluyveromyces marxianus]KAG0685953.1 snoRNA-binding rRNA-processing protein imp4 [Kluyveromyces marxianus]QGN16132.1 U3 small nucleolar ribonucleoprotein IMP4 [Kluyveromyces marxianus]BAO40399.1 U3 small nucleolar ribonucleoprotein protein IMP4 [Kluyveromyces marxianus DMKU3-1042]BAP71888.1 U3 small nucleolar ribonucleoprotein protein IMP4 [Kluyvero